MECETALDATARFGHALSDPTRARVLTLLAVAPRFPSDLADELGVSRQLMSNHLACLRGCGLVVATPIGRRNRYELTSPDIGAALAHIYRLVLVVDPECARKELANGPCLATTGSR